jgi:predicted nucleic acid-binding protein
VSVFLDSNIWIYALNAGGDARSDKARALITQLIADGQDIVLTHQTVAEVVNILKRERCDVARITAAIKSFEAFTWCTPSLETLNAAHLLNAQHKVSWYDATLVQAALDAGCERFYSVDLQHGRKFGALAIVNPFLD